MKRNRGPESDEQPKRNRYLNRSFREWKPRNSVGDNDDDKEDLHRKPVLLSQVVSAVKETKSRNEALEEQPPTDEKSKARNRRMFGIILGTLQKFQSEESQRKPTTARRAQIEEKLEQEAEKERDAVRKEKKELYKKKRESQALLRKTELKMERVQVHEEWEKSHKTLINFIQTKTKPHLFYLPKEHTEESEKRWKQTKDKFRFILAEKRAKVQKELSEIDEMYKKETETQDIDDSKEVEMDSHENTNTDAIEPMEDSIDHEVKGCKTVDDKVNESSNSGNIDNKRDKVNDDITDLESNQKDRGKITKYNKKGGKDEVKEDDDDDDEDEVINRNKKVTNDQEDETSNNNNGSDRVDNKIETSNHKTSDSINNHTTETITATSNNNNLNETIVDSSMDNQPNDADKSSSEQLAEKEFEPIYDGDE